MIEERRKALNARVPVLLLIAVIFALAFTACGTAETPMVEETMPPPTPTPEPTSLPDQTAFHDALAANIHGDYDLGKGPNDYCSRCHSPKNWNPESYPGEAPNCVACKFPFDPEVRQVDSMNFVAEEDWVGIACENCHEMENGVSTGEYAWLDVQTSTYREVKTSTELCEMCHNNSPSFMGGGEMANAGVTHKVEMAGSAHANVGFNADPRPQYCTDCHDPHTLEAKQCTDCHTNLSEAEVHQTPNFHLAFVECMTCHNADVTTAAGDKVTYAKDPAVEDEADAMFVPVVTSMGRGGPTTTEYISHSIARGEICDRCHFEDNPMGLTWRNPDGERPQTDICVDDEDVTAYSSELDTYGVEGTDYTVGKCGEEEGGPPGGSP